MTKSISTITAILAVCLLSACGRGDDDDAGELQSGTGVTADTISLGALPDLSGPFAAIGESMVQGHQLFWDEYNDAGGVCGRTVEIDVQDNRYDPQRAISIYRGMSEDVLAISLLLGSPVVNALQPSIEQDEIVTSLSAWTSEVLPSETIFITGATYDIEAINAIDFLMRNEGLKEGDKVGHLYFEGDYGDNALAGSTYAAEELGLEIVPQAVAPTDTDLTAQVNELERSGVSAILLTVASPQTASVASVARSQGFDVPIAVNGPGFTPQIVETPAGDALENGVYVISSVAPFAFDSPEVEEVRRLFEKGYPDAVPSQVGVMFGYAQGQVMAAVLEQACENDDLTRTGMIAARGQLTELDLTPTVAGALDYSSPAAPPTRMVYASAIDASAPGALEAVGEAFNSEVAESYELEAAHAE